MKNFSFNKKSYLTMIQELSNEIGISIEEAKSLVDTALSFIDLKEEILTFLVINMFSLICKL